MDIYAGCIVEFGDDLYRPIPVHLDRNNEGVLVWVEIEHNPARYYSLAELEGATIIWTLVSGEKVTLNLGTVSINDWFDDRGRKCFLYREGDL